MVNQAKAELLAIVNNACESRLGQSKNFKSFGKLCLVHAFESTLEVVDRAKAKMLISKIKRVKEATLRKSRLAKKGRSRA